MKSIRFNIVLTILILAVLANNEKVLKMIFTILFCRTIDKIKMIIKVKMNVDCKIFDVSKLTEVGQLKREIREK